MKNAFKKILSFIGWCISLIGLPKVFDKKNYLLDEVVVYSVHSAFFLWGMILTGFVSSFIVRHWPVASVFMGWVYIWVFLYTMLAILFDLGTVKILITTVTVGFIWVSSSYLESVRSLHLLSWVFSYIGALKPAITPGFASVISWLLLIPWLLSIFHSFSYGRITFSANVIEERHIGIGNEVTDRAGLKFRAHYDDLLECLLGFGTGNLEAFNNDKIVKKFDNILMLFFWWSRLDELLHQRATVVDNSAEEAVQVEEKNIAAVVAAVK